MADVKNNPALKCGRVFERIKEKLLKKQMINKNNEN